MSGFDENIKNEYLKLLKHYDRLGWKIIPLEGKRPFWKEWDNPEKWRNGGYSNEETINEIITSRIKFNVGILTGEINNIIAIDVDQPNLVGFNPDYVIKQGALAHTTSKAPRIVLYSNNPEVLAFSKKLGKKWTELTEEEKEIVIDKEKYEDIPEFCYCASKDEVTSKDYSLVPSKYIEFVNRDENIDFDTKMKTLQSEFKTLLEDEEKSKSDLLEVFKELGYEI